MSWRDWILWPIARKGEAARWQRREDFVEDKALASMVESTIRHALAVTKDLDALHRRLAMLSTRIDVLEKKIELLKMPDHERTN